MEINELVKNIYEIPDIESMKIVQEAFHTRWNELQTRENNRAKVGLKVGDRVKWMSRRSRREEFGKLIRKNRSTAAVEVEPTGMEWRIPFGMLSKADRGGNDAGI